MSGVTGSTGAWDGSTGGGLSGHTGLPRVSKMRRVRPPRGRYPCLPVHVEWGAGRLPKVQRNDWCPCGSGRKYKKCCGR